MYGAYVLLSGGVDSTTALYKAHSKHVHDMLAISIDYGQRHVKELECAKESCDILGIDYHRIDASSLMPKTMLTNKDDALPDAAYADLPAGISPTYVPFRNGMMLSIAAAFIQGQIQIAWNTAFDESEMIGMDSPLDPFKGPGQLRKEIELYYGAHAEDSANWAYPDCTPEFNGAIANAIYIGSYQNIRLHTPLQWMEKHEVISLGYRLGVDYSNTWSCYAGEDQHCGTCPTCRARKEAFKLAQITDPTSYRA